MALYGFQSCFLANMVNPTVPAAQRLNLTTSAKHESCVEPSIFRVTSNRILHVYLRRPSINQRCVLPNYNSPAVHGVACAVRCARTPSSLAAADSIDCTVRARSAGNEAPLPIEAALHGSRGACSGCSRFRSRNPDCPRAAAASVSNELSLNSPLFPQRGLRAHFTSGAGLPVPSQEA